MRAHFRRKFSSIAPAVLLTLFNISFATERDAVSDPHARDIEQLLNWAVHLSQYPKPEKHPTVKPVSHDFLVFNACNAKECNVVGWYNDQEIIYIDQKLMPLDTLMDRSVMVHELVHYLQHHSGQFTASCSDQLAREREAYEIQRQYFFAYGSLSPVRMHPMRCADPILAENLSD